MLATICDDTWNVLNMQHTISQIRKGGIIQSSPVVAINRLKDPPTWLKVATTLEKPPTPTHCIFLREKKKWHLINISLEFVQEGPVGKSLLVQVMAWYWMMLREWSGVGYEISL